MYLRAGQEVRVSDLLGGIVTASANDASVVLAAAVAGDVAGFTGLMNERARELGLKDSHFGTANGWPDGGRTVVSARDLVVLSTALIERHPELYRRYFGHSAFEWGGAVLRNRNPLYGATAGADGVKTGHTNEAGYNFVGTAERGGRRVLMVLGGASSEASRRDESRAFVEWAFAAWDAKPLFRTGDQVGQVKVQGGASRTVALAAPRALFATMPKGEHPPYQLAIRYAGPLVAPLKKGQPAGSLVVRMEGASPVELPLVVAADVAAANPVQRLRNGLMDLVGL
jgi:D-alanyl-D-alanine carboxypeptidase (penicillin-binding protein 5/6)